MLREIEFKREPIDENIEILGAPYCYVYFVKSEDKNILIDTGTAFWGFKLKEFFLKNKINKIDYILLTQSHYDHLGGIPVIKQEIEIKKIGAHIYVKKVMKSDRAISLINELNMKELNFFKEKKLIERIDYKFHPIEINIEVKDGKIIEFNNIKIIFYETPGHTRDSVTYYIPHLKLAIVGEACGIPNGDMGYILPQFLYSFKEYLKSLEKIEKLEIEILGLPHERVIKGRKNIRKFLEDSRKNTIEYIEDIKNKIEVLKEFDKVLNSMIEDYYYKRKLRQPIHAYTENLKAQIRCVAKEMELKV